MATITGGTRNHTRKHYLAAACGALLALAVAAGIGTWRLAEHGGGSTAGVATTAGSAAQSSVAPYVDQRRTYYLVGSEEQAAELRQELLQATRDARDNGVSVPAQVRNAVVTVISSAEEEAQFWQLLKDERDARQGLGQPGILVVNLRTR
jgi:hypothetical protein